jgi:hypothetical protein
MTDPHLAEALGVYVEPADYEDVVQAIDAHGGELLVQLTSASGDLVWHKSGHLLDHITGWSHHALSDADGDEDKAARSDVFIIGAEQRGLGSLLIYPDVTLVLDLSPRGWFEAARYSSGVRIELNIGGALTIVFWHGVLHVTETGDVAPGFGDFGATVELTDEDR